MFNGWAKYKNCKNDNKINDKLSKIIKLEKINPTIKKNGKLRKVIMEGGAFDVNGAGTILLTEECLLSKIQERNKKFNDLVLKEAAKILIDQIEFNADQSTNLLTVNSN